MRLSHAAVLKEIPQGDTTMAMRPVLKEIPQGDTTMAMRPMLKETVRNYYIVGNVWKGKI